MVIFIKHAISRMGSALVVPGLVVGFVMVLASTPGYAEDFPPAAPSSSNATVVTPSESEDGAAHEADPHASMDYVDMEDLLDFPHGDESDGWDDYFAENDPLEPFNRVMFEFNLALNSLFLEQAALMYRTVVPSILRDRVHDFLANLTQPLSTINYALQGDGEAFVDSLARFLMNTVFGIGGLFDVASEACVMVEPQDYNDTMARWGVASGPYLVLPLLGPTTLRGAVGMVGYYFTDPFNVWVRRHHHNSYVWARSGVDAVDKRSRNYKHIAEIERDALDFYATVRSLYFQNVLAQITDRGIEADNPHHLSTLDTPLPLGE